MRSTTIRNLFTLASVSGGASPYTYEWSDPSGRIAFSPSANSASVSITLPNQRTVVTIEVVAEDVNGSVSTDRIDIVVNPT